MASFINFPRPQLIYSSSRNVVPAAALGPAGSITFNSRLPRVKAKAAAVSPWLMLPPSLDGADIVYDFYSLGDGKVVSFNKRRSGNINEELPDDESEFVGMSHGWLVCYNLNHFHQGDGNIFLSDPLSHRHVKLPSALNLPHKSEPGTCLRMRVWDVIISSADPLDDQNCRALMIYGPARRLAFCCPARGSSGWTPFGKKEGGYCSSVYYTRLKRFFCLTENNGIEVWDLNNVNSPVMYRPFKNLHIPQNDQGYPVSMTSNQERNAKFLFQPSTSLVLDHESDDLYQVRRFTVCRIGPNGSHMIMKFGELGHVEIFPYKTTDFDVYKYDKTSKDWKYMDGRLDGMAIFIGKNHAFLLPAANYPKLKPDSIYFTDIEEDPSYFKIGGGHDMGIYNYRNKTISPCYYPCDYHSIKKILPPPLWFTPNYPPTLPTTINTRFDFLHHLLRFFSSFTF